LIYRHFNLLLSSSLHNFFTLNQNAQRVEIISLVVINWAHKPLMLLKKLLMGNLKKLSISING